jgi:hypothetical protein
MVQVTGHELKKRFEEQKAKNAMTKERREVKALILSFEFNFFFPQFNRNCSMIVALSPGGLKYNAIGLAVGVPLHLYFRKHPVLRQVSLAPLILTTAAGYYFCHNFTTDECDRQWEESQNKQLPVAETH